MRVYARLTANGTACAETALCEEHLTAANKERFLRSETALLAPPITHWVDCTGNEALACRVCGISGVEKMPAVVEEALREETTND